MNKTAMLLMLQYERAAVPLDMICEEFFSCSRHTAIQKAKAGLLPVPAFQTSDSQKSPWMVHINDLADLIDNRLEQARAEWERVA